MTMKTRMKIKSRSHRYDIIRPRPRHGHKYTKYKICLNIVLVLCIKQHLSNTESEFKKSVAYKKSVIQRDFQAHQWTTSSDTKRAYLERDLIAATWWYLLSSLTLSHDEDPYHIEASPLICRDWFLYDRDLHYERVKIYFSMKQAPMKSEYLVSCNLRNSPVGNFSGQGFYYSIWFFKKCFKRENNISYKIHSFWNFDLMIKSRQRGIWKSSMSVTGII